MSSASTFKTNANFVDICGIPNSFQISKFDYENLFTGMSPLFACEYSCKTLPCNMCSGKLYDAWDVSCDCDKNQDYQIIHMIVSVNTTETHSDKVSTLPNNSVYQINIVNEYLPYNQFGEVRSRAEGIQSTTFSIFDTMEIDSNLVDTLKNTTKMLDSESAYEKKSTYFYTFDGIAKPELYYNSFYNLFQKYLNYSKVLVDEKKENPHIKKKKK